MCRYEGVAGGFCSIAEALFRAGHLKKNVARGRSVPGGELPLTNQLATPKVLLLVHLRGIKLMCAQIDFQFQVLALGDEKSRTCKSPTESSSSFQ